MIRTALGLTAALTALGVVGHFDQQDEIAADEHYCEMVAIYERWVDDHPLEIGREARARRPGWPPHRDDIDCRKFGFSAPLTFSKH